MERVVYFRLRWWTESHLIIPEIQMGFRPSRLCIDNLTTLTNHIHAANLAGQFTVCVFVDIVGAFDNVIPSILVDTLRNLGIPAKLRRFIQNLTSEREVFFC